jgi:hypothetical protein
MADSMKTDTIITQLGSLKAYCTSMAASDSADPVWADDVVACDVAISIIYAITNAGARDADEVADLLQDYNKLAKQYKAMHKKYEIAQVPVLKDNMWCCPACNRRVAPYHSHCHWCGKKLEGW